MTNSPVAENPLLTPSTLPYQLPDFANLRAEHGAPAFRAGMDEVRAEIDAIVNNPEPPTFENTVEAMERGGQTLARAATYVFALSSALGTPEFDAAENEVAPLYAQFRSELYMNRGLYERIKAVSESGAAFTAEQRHLLDELLRDFELSGVNLGAAEGARLVEINSRIAELESQFGQTATRNRQAAALIVDSADELAGLTDGEIATAAALAADNGHEGKYQISLLSPSSQPALARLQDRDVRRRLLASSLARGLGDGGTTAILRELVALRSEQAAILGFDSHAEYKIADQTAPGLDAVMEMLTRMAPAALANAEREAEIMAEVAGHDIEASDWAFYSDQVQREKYAVDSEALKPYFELNRVLNDGVFFAANQVYGVTFTEREDLVGYHPDVRVWEVFNEDGSPLGLFLGDYFARETKKGGAWMNNLVDQSGLLGNKPVVMNNLNIPKPPEGSPALLTMDEVRTAFHEFGHALHGLFSDVYYPRLQGTNVPRDFVEYPSQVNEMWILWPEVIANYAKHYETGEPLPAETVVKLQEAALWGEGFGTTEYLKAALLDLAWYGSRDAQVPEDVEAFETEAMNAVGLQYDLVPPRYRSAYFAHIFAGGYSAGYYSYIWSEVLDAETVEWFKENGGMTRANGDKMRFELLARGNSRDPLESFRVLRGRDASVEPLLKKRGLA